MNDKPRKLLTGAVFIGGSLWGNHPEKPGEQVKCSRVVACLGPNIFETMNTIYTVEFVPKGESTIPDEWRIPTDKAKAFVEANKLSPVVSGAAFAEGGGNYTLKDGQNFDLSLADCQSMPMPRWDF